MQAQSPCGDGAAVARDAVVTAACPPTSGCRADEADPQPAHCGAPQSPTAPYLSMRAWSFFMGGSAIPLYVPVDLSQQACGQRRQVSMKLPDLEPEDLPSDFLESFAARLTASSGGQMTIASAAARRGCVIIVLDVIGPWQPQATLAAVASAAGTAAAADASGMGASAVHVLPPPLAALLAALPVQRQLGMRVVFRQPAATAAAAGATAAASGPEAAGAAAQERAQREAGVVVEWAGPEHGWRMLPSAAVPALPAGEYGHSEIASSGTDAGVQMLPAERHVGGSDQEAGQWVSTEGSLSLRSGPPQRSGLAEPSASPAANARLGVPPAASAHQQRPWPPSQYPNAVQQQRRARDLPSSRMILASGGHSAAGTAATVAAATGSGRLSGSSCHLTGARVAATSTAGAVRAGASPSSPSSGEHRASSSPPAHILCSLRSAHGSAADLRSKESEAGGTGGRWQLQASLGPADGMDSVPAGRVLSAGGSIGVAPGVQLSTQQRARSFGGSGAATVLGGGVHGGAHVRGSGAASHVPSGGAASLSSDGSVVTSTGSVRVKGLKQSRGAPPIGATAAGSVDSGSGSGGSTAATAVATAAAAAAAAGAASIFRRRARSASVPYGHPNGVRALLETHHEHGEELPSPPRRKRADTPGPQSGPAGSGQAPASADGADEARGGRAGASHLGARTSYGGDEYDVTTSDTAIRDVTRSATPRPPQHVARAAVAPAVVSQALGSRSGAAPLGAGQDQGGRAAWGRTVSGGVMEGMHVPIALRWGRAAPAAATAEGYSGFGGQGGALAASSATTAMVQDATVRATYARTGSFMRPGALAATVGPAADAAGMSTAAGAGSAFSSGLHAGPNSLGPTQSQGHNQSRHTIALRQLQSYRPGSSMASRVEWGAVNTDLDLLWSSPRPWAVTATAATGPRRGPLQPASGAGGSIGAGGQQLTPYLSSGSAAAAMAAATALVASGQGSQQQRQRSAARHLPVTAAGGAAAAAQELSSTGLLSNLPPQALDTGFTEACAWLMQTQRQPPLQPPPPLSHSQPQAAQRSELQQSLKALPQPQPRQTSPCQQKQQQRQARSLRPEQAVRQAQRMRLLWRGGSGEAPARLPSTNSAGSDDADLHMLDEALASLVAEYQHPLRDDATGAAVADGVPTAAEPGRAAGAASTATAAAAEPRGQPPTRHVRPRLRLQEASEGEPELEALLLGWPQEPHDAAAEEGSGGSDVSGSAGPVKATSATRPGTRARGIAPARAADATAGWAGGVSITAVGAAASSAAATAAATAAAAGPATASSGINSGGTVSDGPTSSAVAVAPLGFAAAAAAAVTASQSSGGPGTGAGAQVDTSMSIAAAVGVSGLMSLSQPAAPFLKVRQSPTPGAGAAADATCSASTAALLASDAMDTAGSTEATTEAAVEAPPYGKGNAGAATHAATQQRRPQPDRERSISPPVQAVQAADAADAAAGAGTGGGGEEAPGTARLGGGSGRRPASEPPGGHFQGQFQTYGAASAYCDSFWATTIPEATGEGSQESGSGDHDLADAHLAPAVATHAPAAAAVAAAAAAAAHAEPSVKEASARGSAAAAAALAALGTRGTSQGTAVRVGGCSSSALRALSSGLDNTGEDDGEEDEGGLVVVGLDTDAGSDGEAGAEAAELGALLTRVSSATIRRVALEAMEGNWLGRPDGAGPELVGACPVAMEDGGPDRQESRDSRSGRWGTSRSSWSGRGPPPPSGHETSAEGTSGGLPGRGRAPDQSMFATLPDAAEPLEPSQARPAHQPQRQEHNHETLAQPSHGLRAAPRQASYQLRRSAAAYGAFADSAAMANAVAAATGLDSIAIFTDADPWASSPWDRSAAAAAAAGAAGGAAGEAAVAAAMMVMGPPTLEPAALVPPPTPMCCVSLTVHGLPPAWAAAPPPTSGADVGAGGGGGAVAAGPSAWRRSSVMSTLSVAANGGGAGSYWGMLTTFVSPPGDEAAAAAANGASPRSGATGAGGAGGSGGGADGGGGLLVAVRCAGRYLPVQWTWRHQQHVGAAAAEAGASTGAGALVAGSPALELSVSGLMGQGLLVVEVWYGGVYYASLPAVVTYDPRLVDDLLGRHTSGTSSANGATHTSLSHRHARRHRHSERRPGDAARHHRSSAVQAAAAGSAGATATAAVEQGRSGGVASAAPRAPVPDDVVYDLGIWLQYVASTAPLFRREALAVAASAAMAATAPAAPAATALDAVAPAPPPELDAGAGLWRPTLNTASAAEARVPRSGFTAVSGRVHPAAESPAPAVVPAPAPARGAPRRALMDTAATFHLGGPQTTTQEARGGGAAAAAAAAGAAGAADTHDRPVAGASGGGHAAPVFAGAASPPDDARPGSDASLLPLPMQMHVHHDHDQEQEQDPMQGLQPSDILRYTTAPGAGGGLEPWLPRSGDTTGSSQIFSSSSVAAFAARSRTVLPLPSAPVPVAALPEGASAGTSTVVASANNVAMSIPADFQAAEAAAAAAAASTQSSTFRSDGTAFSNVGIHSQLPNSASSAADTAGGAARGTAAAALAALAEPLAALEPSGGSGAEDEDRGLGAAAITATSASMLDSAPPSRRRICHDSAADMTVPILPGSVDMSAAVATLQRGPAYGQQMQELAVGLLAWLVFAGRPVAAAVVLRGLMGHRALRFTEVCEEVRRLGSGAAGAAARGAGGGGIPGLGTGSEGAAGGGFAAVGYGGMGLLHLAVHSGRREMIEAVVGWSAALSPVSQAAGRSSASNNSRATELSPAAAAPDLAAAGLSVAVSGAALPASEWCELCAAGVGPLHLAAALVMPAATVAVGAAPGASGGGGRSPDATAAAADAAPGLEGVDAAGLDTLVWLLTTFPETRALWGIARDAYGTTPGAILSYYLRALPPASADAVRLALVPLVGPEWMWVPASLPELTVAERELGYGLHSQRLDQHQQPPASAHVGAAELQPAWARHLSQQPQQQQQQPQQQQLQQLVGGTGNPTRPAAVTVAAVGDGGSGEEAVGGHRGANGVHAVARAMAGEAAELGAVPAVQRLARIARLLAALAAAAVLRPHAPPANPPGSAAAATSAAPAQVGASNANAAAAGAGNAGNAASARADSIRVALGAEVRALLRELLLQAVADPAPVMLVAMALLAVLVVRVWDALSPPGQQ